MAASMASAVSTTLACSPSMPRMASSMAMARVPASAQPSGVRRPWGM